MTTFRMNPAIRKPYVGVDSKGNSISGIILHVGHYSKSGQPLDYVLSTEPNGNGRPGFALVPADLVNAHLAGLDLFKKQKESDDA